MECAYTYLLIYYEFVLLSFIKPSFTENTRYILESLKLNTKQIAGSYIDIITNISI